MKNILLRLIRFDVTEVRIRYVSAILNRCSFYFHLVEGQQANMEFISYEPKLVHRVFESTEELQYLVGQDEYYTPWYYLKGYCLETDNPYCDECRPPLISYREDHSLEQLPNFELGSCTNCKSAGTIGYNCQVCGEHKHKRLHTMMQFVLDDGHRRNARNTGPTSIGKHRCGLQKRTSNPHT